MNGATTADRGTEIIDTVKGSKQYGITGLLGL